MKHTPGPWQIRADLAITAYDTETEEHQPVARAFGDGSRENTFSNSRLIAAAPDLLFALERLIEWCELMGTREDNYRLIAARAAIAKATGE